MYEAYLGTGADSETKQIYDGGGLGVNEWDYNTEPTSCEDDTFIYNTCQK